MLGAFGHDYLGLTFSPDDNRLYFTRVSQENNAANDIYVMPVALHQWSGYPIKLVMTIIIPDAYSILASFNQGGSFRVQWAQRGVAIHQL